MIEFGAEGAMNSGTVRVAGATQLLIRRLAIACVLITIVILWCGQSQADNTALKGDLGHALVGPAAP